MQENNVILYLNWSLCSVVVLLRNYSTAGNYVHVNYSVLILYKVRGYTVETTVKRFFYMFAVYKYGTYTYHGQGTYIICEM